MGTLTERFPDRISRGMVGGPTYNTGVAFLPNGLEQRNNSGRTRGQHRYEVSRGIKDDDDARVSDAFFRKARGKLHNFRVKDCMDYQLATSASRLVLITSTTFRISKVYGGDEPTFEEVRPLTRLVTGTVSVFKDAVLVAQAPGAGNCTVDLNTGIVTFGTAPGGSVLTASGQFDVLCRFDFDDKQSELVTRKPDGTLLIRWDAIRLLEDMRG